MRRKSKSAHGSDSLCGTLFAPESKWRIPTSFPDLSSVKRIGLDTEGKIPDIDAGPTFIQGTSKLAGVSVSTDDCSWYFPVGHLCGPNLDPGMVGRYLNDVFASPSLEEVVGANLQMELESLWSIGVNIPDRIKHRDIQIAEPLLDEERDLGYSLDDLSLQYGLPLKDEVLLREAASAYGVNPKADLWKLPPIYAGAYAERDALNPLKIYDRQVVSLKEDNLWDAFELETELLPLLWKMRLQGIPVDLEGATQSTNELKKMEDEFRLRMIREFKRDLDVWSGPEIARVCDELNLYYRKTDKGNSSFPGEWLDGQSHPFFKLISDIREVNRLRTTFIDKWIFKNQFRGRVHCQWKQLKSDDGGTRTARMAAANPNPQQVPARSELAPLIRRCFRAPAGERWYKGDYSQQEPRLLVHYAALCGFTGAYLVREAYKDNPNMDIYEFLAKSADIARRQSKDLTLGRCYGMGKDKLAKKLGLTKEKAEELLEKFDNHVPFVKEISDSCMRNAQQRGWIKGICGHKRHFNYWEPADAFERRKKAHELRLSGERIPTELDTTPVSSPEKAKDKWGTKVKFQRAFTHKALNALIQGSAAGMTKIAMVKMYREYRTIPYMQVHDEIDAPVADQDHGRKLMEIQMNCTDCTVPMKVDWYVGDNWK